MFERDEEMDKYTRFNTIVSMLAKKHGYRLTLSEKERALICECDPEQMHQIVSELYKARDTSEEFVKKSIVNIKRQTPRSIGFNSGI